VTSKDIFESLSGRRVVGRIRSAALGRHHGAVKR